MNLVAESLTGWKQAEAIGKHLNEVFNIINEFTGEKVENAVTRVLKEGIIVGLANHTILIRKDETKISIADSAAPIKDKKGNIIGIVLIFRDVTERKKAEQELRLQSVIMTNLSEGVHLIRMDDGIIVYTNPRFEEMFGYDPGELIGKHISIVNAPTDKNPEETAKEIMENLEETGEWHGEVYNLKKDGIPFWCYANVSAFDHPVYGKVTVAIHTDITERKKAEMEISNLAKFPSENPNPILRVTKESIIYLNKVSESIFSIKEGDPLPEMFQDAVIEAININTLKEIEIEIENQIYSFVIAPIEGEVYVNVYGRDITKRKKSEDTLKESEEKYRNAYNRAEFYKDLFTHDINNILQSILSGILLNEIYINQPEGHEKLNETYNVIKDQVKRGAKLVSNIRKLSNLEDNQISIKTIEICSVLEKSITFLKNSYKARNVNIQVHSIGEKLYVQANEFLEDAFENVLINAIKYNENSIVEILVKISREQKNGIDYLKMEFKDNGIGIDDSKKDLIFQRGYMEGKSVYGMGLGLSLVKKIIETYNGKIWVEDRVKGDQSKGSNFIVLIPEVL